MWYAMQVKTGTEELVCSLCKAWIPASDLEDCFYPKYEFVRKINGKRGIVTEPLFPGYLFLDVEPERIMDVYSKLWHIPELTKLLKVGSSFVPITAEERAFIEDHSSDHVFLMSKGYIEGDRVVIEEGAFATYSGKLEYIDRHNRFGVIKIKMFGRERFMKFGLEITKKISENNGD